MSGSRALSHTGLTRDTRGTHDVQVSHGKVYKDLCAKNTMEDSGQMMGNEVAMDGSFLASLEAGSRVASTISSGTDSPG